MIPNLGMLLRTLSLSLAIALMVAAPLRAGHQGSQAAGAPRLVVVLVVDQLRADYLDLYSQPFTGGLARLMKEGAWFKNAAYPYLNTITCAGHSTIGTGALPYRHGMVLNQWFDRKTTASTACTTDVRTKEIPFGLTPPDGPGESGENLLVPTFADQVREHAKGRVVTMSLKARSAIGMAGRRGDAVIWYDERGTFATSTAFSNAVPPAVAAFLEKNPIAADYGKAWERLRDAATYKFDDDGVGERAPATWKATFPHALLSPAGKADGTFYQLWQLTPYADEYLGRMAAAAIDDMQLGRGPNTDFLGVSFSTLDLVGHAYGPRSHEVQDVVARLDVTIGRLLDHLDAKVGRGNYVLALGSDHGVAELPEQVPGAGRVPSRDVTNAINTALSSVWETGQYVVATAYTDVYLAPGVAGRLKSDAKASDAVLNALRSTKGIAYAFRADEISDPSLRTGADRIKRAAALSYHPDRSGDLIIIPVEHWLLASSATTHGTLWPYDQRVPIIFHGAGVKAGQYATDATPADIVTTLAALAKVPFKPLDGRVLKDALR